MDYVENSFAVHELLKMSLILAGTTFRTGLRVNVVGGMYSMNARVDLAVSY